MPKIEMTKDEALTKLLKIADIFNLPTAVFTAYNTILEKCNCEITEQDTKQLWLTIEIDNKYGWVKIRKTEIKEYIIALKIRDDVCQYLKNTKIDIVIDMSD